MKSAFKFINEVLIWCFLIKYCLGLNSVNLWPNLFNQNVLRTPIFWPTLSNENTNLQPSETGSMYSGENFISTDEPLPSKLFIPVEHFQRKFFNEETNLENSLPNLLTNNLSDNLLDNLPENLPENLSDNLSNNFQNTKSNFNSHHLHSNNHLQHRFKTSFTHLLDKTSNNFLNKESNKITSSDFNENYNFYQNPNNDLQNFKKIKFLNEYNDYQDEDSIKYKNLDLRSQNTNRFNLDHSQEDLVKDTDLFTLKKKMNENIFFTSRKPKFNHKKNKKIIRNLPISKVKTYSLNKMQNLNNFQRVQPNLQSPKLKDTSNLVLNSFNLGTQPNVIPAKTSRHTIKNRNGDFTVVTETVYKNAFRKDLNSLLNPKTDWSKWNKVKDEKSTQLETNNNNSILFKQATSNLNENQAHIMKSITVSNETHNNNLYLTDNVTNNSSTSSNLMPNSIQLFKQENSLIRNLIAKNQLKKIQQITQQQKQKQLIRSKHLEEEAKKFNLNSNLNLNQNPNSNSNLKSNLNLKSNTIIDHINLTQANSIYSTTWNAQRIIPTPQIDLNTQQSIFTKKSDKIDLEKHFSSLSYPTTYPTTYSTSYPSSYSKSYPTTSNTSSTFSNVNFELNSKENNNFSSEQSQFQLNGFGSLEISAIVISSLIAALLFTVSSLFLMYKVSQIKKRRLMCFQENGLNQFESTIPVVNISNNNSLNRQNQIKYSFNKTNPISNKIPYRLSTINEINSNSLISNNNFIKQQKASLFNQLDSNIKYTSKDMSALKDPYLLNKNCNNTLQVANSNNMKTSNSNCLDNQLNSKKNFVTTLKTLSEQKNSALNRFWSKVIDQNMDSNNQTNHQLMNENTSKVKSTCSTFISNLPTLNNSSNSNMSNSKINFF